jgi:hypothetical protein
MLASDVIAICESNGIGELARMYQLSRRQAEGFAIQARRVLASGSNPVMVPGTDAGTVRASQRPQEPPEGQGEGQASDDQAPSLEDNAAAMARRIKSESAGVAGASVANLRAQLAVCDRNIDKGYPEWGFQARLLRRTLELVEVPV